MFIIVKELELGKDGLNIKDPKITVSKRVAEARA
jgi:hypothetical protein